MEHDIKIPNISNGKRIISVFRSKTLDLDRDTRYFESETFKY